jgi:hypothetical protein
MGCGGHFLAHFQAPYCILCPSPTSIVSLLIIAPYPALPWKIHKKGFEKRMNWDAYMDAYLKGGENLASSAEGSKYVHYLVRDREIALKTEYAAEQRRQGNPVRGRARVAPLRSKHCCEQEAAQGAVCLPAF